MSTYLMTKCDRCEVEAPNGDPYEGWARLAVTITKRGQLGMLESVFVANLDLCPRCLLLSDVHTLLPTKEVASV